MSLPYMPGWGDTLAQHLPKLGQDIAKIANPYREQEDMFMKLIATKPELMDEYAQREQDSPGALSGIFGKKVSDFVRGQPLSEGYKVQRAREKSALKGSELGNEAAKIGIDKETLEYIQDKDLWDTIQSNPNIQEAWRYGKTTGATSGADLKNRMRTAKQIQTRAAQAQQYAGKSGTELAYMYKNRKISTEDMQGLIENNPGAMSAAFAIMDDEERGRLQRDLQEMSSGSQDRYLRNLMWRESATAAKAMGIDNPNAYAEIVFGKSLEGFPEPSEDDREQAGNVFAAADAARDLKSSENQRKADQAIFDKIRTDLGTLGSTASIPDEDRAILEGGINANLARLGKNYGYTSDQIPRFERIPGGFITNNDRWTIGGKKIGPNEMSTFMNKLTLKIMGVEDEGPPKPVGADTTGTRRPPRGGRRRNPFAEPDSTQ